MMQSYQQLKDIKNPVTCKKHRKYYSNVIYTFDIETTSMFYLNNKWSAFVYDDNIDYTQVEKAAVPYIWMFSINDAVYYGREFYDFGKVLSEISDPLITKILWCHNLSFEMVFLMDLLKDYTIENMVAREKRKPISFHVKELNIDFRCSYMLTNMKLDTAAKYYTHIQKKTGDLDYNQVRSPLTKMEQFELDYCEYDCKCVYEIILSFIDKYNSIANIPLTSTSTVRYEIKKIVDFWYIKSMQDLVPPPEMYLIFWYAFSGGYTHCNILKTSKILTAYRDDGSIDEDKIILSFDLASAYPAALCTQKYPCRPFLKCAASFYYDEKKREKYAFVMKVECKNIKSRFYNHYLQYDKVKDTAINAVVDNGRISSLSFGILYCTDVDLDILRANYRGEFIIKECYKSFKKYLDIRIIKFILSLFQNKTKLKNIVSEDDELYEYYDNIYRTSKSLLNGIYGMAVTSILHTVDFYNNDWQLPKSLDPELKQNLGKTKTQLFNNFVAEKLDDARTSFSTLFYYPTGIFCTAYCRSAVFMRLISSHEFDVASIYVDTDSIKFQGKKHIKIFEEYNKNVYESYLKVIKYYPELTIDDFCPTDAKGNKHCIGYFELDGEYLEFCSHGAKKYAYRDKKDNELHITVSGVAKSGVKVLNNDIRNFTKNCKWGYSESGKLTHYYKDEQPDITFIDKDGNSYTSHQRHAVILEPTSYTMSLTPIYEALSHQIQNDYIRRLSIHE